MRRSIEARRRKESLIRVVAISDTHGRHGEIEIPDGEVLIHAGDLTRSGRLHEVEELDAFLATLPHPHKIIIAGNHDWCFQLEPHEARARVSAGVYLEDGAHEIEGIAFYGSPWQPWFMDWAFNLERGAEIAEKWDLIPTGTDVLITHGPPHGWLDENNRGDRVGCEELLRAVARVRPRFHVFGHIHEGYGESSDGTTRFVNASVCDLAYRPVNAPRVFEIEGAPT